jgi:plasmanylethanolamine desaturase
MTEQKKERAVALAGGYTKGHRLYELGGITLTSVTTIWLLVLLFKAPTLSGWWMPLAALMGILFADFISGFVHWMFDTWGSVDTPIVGALAIRTFRHHHVDRKAMLQHDFIETNGHNIALSTICSTSGILLCTLGSVTQFDVFCASACVCAIAFVSLTSQIHKWAHMEEDAPKLIQLLQRTRIILSPEHHDSHHAAPYNRNYCITVGWMNGPLRAVRFFETAEWLITAVTGALPREDDIGKDQAIAVVVAQSEEVVEKEPVAIPSRD